MRVLVASRNAKKVAEMQRVLTASGITVVGLADVPAYDEPVEDAPDFAGNALLKARAAYAVTGLVSVADDSGLCVDALRGMPGVLSARWSGCAPAAGESQDERNNRLLLDQLHDVPDERRGAHFACAVAVVHGQGEDDCFVVEGRMSGRVVREPRGTGGFGYDVVFEADARPGLTTAELTPEEKDALSHRGEALRLAAPRLAALAGS